MHSRKINSGEIGFDHIKSDTIKNNITQKITLFVKK